MSRIRRSLTTVNGNKRVATLGTQVPPVFV